MEQSAKTPADEIGITREMTDAGADLISELYGVVSASYLAERVYIAMVHKCIPKRQG